MPRGYRCIIVAAVGWLILSGAQHPAKQPHRSTSAQETAPAAKPIATPTPPPSASEPAKFVAYPGYDPDPCYHAENKDAADLCAQWRAAIAAEKAVQEAGRATTWAVVATALSFIGVCGLIYTIWQTQGSLGEARRGNRLAMKANARATRQAISGARDTAEALAIAKRNADAADKQIEIAADAMKDAREIGERQVRAYVAVLDPEWVVRPGAAPILWVQTTYKNLGSTPALNVVSEQQIMVVVAPIGIVTKALGDTLAPILKMDHGSVGVLGKGETTKPRTANGSEVPMNLAELIASGNAAVLVRGWIEYVDVLGASHKTEYCFHSDARSVAAGQDFHISPFGNGMT